MGKIAKNRRIVTCQLTDAEHLKLKQIAAREGATVSDLIRQAVADRYTTATPISKDLKDHLRSALGIGYQAAMEYAENEIQELKAAEEFADYGKEIKVTAKKTNAFRDTFCTFLFSADPNPLKIAALMKHRNPNTMFESYLGSLRPKSEGLAYCQLRPELRKY